ncbi:MFS transporter [Ramlibacter humi]|uniref:MFS transporter n=1 Tax=Ramlibacter humi TaxID=2530451 RepID=A0A4Z0BFR9_9BURK|nr:MFS transporter [Ramlibacter humi]TFY97219.1 MFS transporter [Ramlibacter humi]
MLLALICGFALSQAFRTVAAILAPPLQQDLGLTPQQLGLFAGVFHFAFGGLQLVMGLSLDIWGPRRTVLTAFPLTIAGAAMAATSNGFTQLLLAQFVIGVGCAPAFLACTVFISRRFEAQRFAVVNGAALGIGSVGLLLTGTPLAWVVEQWSWRAGFVMLGILACAAWLAIAFLVREPPAAAGPRPAVWATLRGYGELFALPHTWGIVALGLFTYASFLSLRGLWLGPLLVERHGLSLVQAGNVALVVSVMGVFGPPLFGRIDPGPRTRRQWIVACTLTVAVLYGVMAFSRQLWLDVAIAVLASLMSGYGTLQYADVRSAYPARMMGRAMAVFTMAMFLGVGVMQWSTGLVAAGMRGTGIETYEAVLAAIALQLVFAAWAFRRLPAPKHAE